METRGNMTEKEQKAIEWLKNANFFSARIYAPSILNLIEKQQKELKKLNIDIEARKEEKCLLIEDMNKYYDICIQQQKEIEELKKENFDTVYIQAIENYKDKIREKIKEIENNYSEHSEFRIGKCIEFLNELLEE